MAGLPWFKLYPKDWRADPALRLCSMATHGVLLQVIMLMHELDHYEISGTVDKLARMCGCTADEMATAIDELEHSNTLDVKRMCNANVTPMSRDVTLVSRRRAKELKAKLDGRLRVRRYRELRKRNANVTGEISDIRDHTGNTSVLPDTDPNGSVFVASKPATCPHEKIIELYHEVLPECPRVRKWTDTRRAHLKARWREGNQDLGGWRRFFEYVKTSDFLVGKARSSNGRAPFVADLAWLVKQENFAKVIEGRYHR